MHGTVASYPEPITRRMTHDLSSADDLLLQLIEHRGTCTRQSLKSLTSARWFPHSGTPEEILERLVSGGGGSCGYRRSPTITSARTSWTG